MNNKFEIIIYWSKDDNCFLAEVPELAGCITDGKSYAEALEKVQVVISEWIKTALFLRKQVPIPKGKLI